jgi:hypothetical protein
MKEAAMKRRLLAFAVSGFLLLNLYGCVLLLAGGAAGVGTAVWLSDKLTQQVNASYDRTVTASEKALRSLNMPLSKESKEAKVTQLRSVYSDGKEVWIDVRKVTENSTKVEVRVGAVNPDKKAAEKILDRIQGNL